MPQKILPPLLRYIVKNANDNVIALQGRDKCHRPTYDGRAIVHWEDEPVRSEKNHRLIIP